MRGKIDNKEYDVIGITPLEDGVGFSLEFIVSDPENKDGKSVGKVIVPMKMAKTIVEQVGIMLKNVEKG